MVEIYNFILKVFAYFFFIQNRSTYTMDIKTINKYIKLNESHSLRVTREAKQLKTQN